MFFKKIKMYHMLRFISLWGALTAIWFDEDNLINMVICCNPLDHEVSFCGRLHMVESSNISFIDQNMKGDQTIQSSVLGPMSQVICPKPLICWNFTKALACVF